MDPAENREGNKQIISYNIHVPNFFYLEFFIEIYSQTVIILRVEKHSSKSGKSIIFSILKYPHKAFTYFQSALTWSNFVFKVFHFFQCVATLNILVPCGYGTFSSFFY